MLAFMKGFAYLLSSTMQRPYSVGCKSPPKKLKKEKNLKLFAHLSSPNNSPVFESQGFSFFHSLFHSYQFSFSLSFFLPPCNKKKKAQIDRTNVYALPLRILRRLTSLSLVIFNNVARSVDCSFVRRPVHILKYAFQDPFHQLIA